MKNGFSLVSGGPLAPMNEYVKQPLMGNAENNTSHRAQETP